jgi:hypothetical protein
VPNDHTFHGPIEWMKESEVTRGCNPPTNDLYCPQDFVTRGQMAAFFERFAQYIDAEDGTPALANAAVGLTEVQYNSSISASANLADLSARSHTTDCPSGSLATGGGGFSSHPRVVIEDSRPTGNGQGWQVLYRNLRGDTAIGYTATVYVVCIQADAAVALSAVSQDIDQKDD